MAIVVVLVLALTTSGMTEASTTLSPSRPWTRQYWVEPNKGVKSFIASCKLNKINGGVMSHRIISHKIHLNSFIHNLLINLLLYML